MISHPGELPGHAPPAVLPVGGAGSGRLMPMRQVLTELPVASGFMGINGMADCRGMRHRPWLIRQKVH